MIYKCKKIDNRNMHDFSWNTCRFLFSIKNKTLTFQTRVEYKSALVTKKENHKKCTPLTNRPAYGDIMAAILDAREASPIPIALSVKKMVILKQTFIYLNYSPFFPKGHIS